MMGMFYKGLHYFFALLSLVICVSCHQRDLSVARYTIDLSSAEVTPNCDLSRILKLDTIIHLETIEESMVGAVRKVFGLGTSYVIWDGKGKKVSVFDRYGGFQHQIGRAGRASDEYLSLDDVWVDPEQELIYLLDSSSKRILSFNKRGSFAGAININRWGTDLAVENQIVWLFGHGLNEEEFLLLKISESGESPNHYFPIRRNEIPIKIGRTCFSRDADGAILFASNYMNRVFRIEAGEISEYVRILFGEKAVDDSDLKSSQYVKEMTAKERVGELHDVYQVGTNLFFSYYRVKGNELNPVYAWHNCETGETLLWDYTARHLPGMNNLPVNGFRGLTSQGQPIMVLDYSILPQGYIERFLQGNEHYGSYFSQCTEDSNPSLLIFSCTK